MALSKHEILIQQITERGIVLDSRVVNDIDRNLPPKKTLDVVDGAMRNPNVKKIIIRKITDYKEGDIF